MACFISALPRWALLKASVPRDSRTLGLRFVGLPAPPDFFSGVGSVSSLVVIENPILRSDEVDGGEDADDEQQHPRHG